MRKPILELDDGKKWQMYSAYQDIADQKAERGDIKETPEHWIQAPTPLPPRTHPLPAPASRTLATQPRCRPATLPPGFSGPPPSITITARPPSSPPLPPPRRPRRPRHPRRPRPRCPHHHQPRTRTARLQVLNLEPSRDNLEELSVMLRQGEVGFVDDFVELHGVEALPALLD